MSTITELLQYPFATKTAEVPGLGPLAYTDAGEGSQTLLLVHGLGSNLKAWGRNLPELSKRFRCLAVDLPGYGKSVKGEFSFSIPFFAEALAGFLDTVGVKTCWLAGHSMGGQIAMRMALQQPGRYRGLLLAAPAGFETFDQECGDWLKKVFTPQNLLLAPRGMIRENMERNFYQVKAEAQELVNDRLLCMQASDYPLLCRAIALSVHGMLNGPVSGEMPGLDLPVLALFGLEDHYIPNQRCNPVTTEAIARAGAARLPRCELHLLPACGHFLPFEAAEVFNEPVVEFVERWG